MRRLGSLALAAVAACMPPRVTSDPPASPIHTRVFVTVRPTVARWGVYTNARGLSCPDLLAQPPMGDVPAGQSVLLLDKPPIFDTRGLTDACRDLAAYYFDNGPMMLPRADLARPGSPEAAALEAKAPTAVAFDLQPAPQDVISLADGTARTLEDGTPVRVIGADVPGTQIHASGGTIAQLDDGTYVWGQYFRTTTDPDWRATQALATRCQEVARTFDDYPALPLVAELLTLPPSNQRYRIVLDARGLVPLPATPDAPHLYLYADPTGAMRLNSPIALLGPNFAGDAHRKVLVRSTNRVLDVGLIQALALDIVDSFTVCAHVPDPP